jgi:hypothetical protein
LEKGWYPSNRGACTLKKYSTAVTRGQLSSHFLSFFGAHSFGDSIFFFSFNLLSLHTNTAKNLVEGGDISLLEPLEGNALGIP